jgi:hypothetical protein
LFVNCAENSSGQSHGRYCRAGRPRDHHTLLEDGSGALEDVEERKQAFVRLDPRPQGVYQQVLLANADQAVFVFACANPAPN